MSLLEKTLSKVKNKEVSRFIGKDKNKRKRTKGGVKTGSPEVLAEETERFSKYINDRFLKKIIDKKSALKWGVEKIGSHRDIHGVLGFEEGQLFFGADKKIKVKAAKKLVELFAKKNLVNVIKTKSGSFAGKMISKNVALRPIVYNRAGKTISYVQAFNLQTGKIIPMKVAKMLMGRLK
jgi:hypothetical protein